MVQTITVALVHALCDHQCWEQDHEDLEPLELNSKAWCIQFMPLPLLLQNIALVMIALAAPPLMRNLT